MIVESCPSQLLDETHTRSESGSETIPAKPLNDGVPIRLVGKKSAVLSGCRSDDVRVGITESCEDRLGCGKDRRIEKRATVRPEQVRAGVLVQHALSVMLRVVPPVIRTGLTPKSSSGTSAPMIANGTSRRRRPRAMSDTTGIR